jgi:hypothetical protein
MKGKRMTLPFEQQPRESDKATSPPNSQPSTLDSNRLAFEQQPKESDKAFAAFTAYLSMGPTRSISRVAQKLDAHRSMVQGWCRRYHWTRRVTAYNNHMAAIERQATEQLVTLKGRDWAAMQEQVRQQAWSEAADLIALAQDFKARWRDSDRLPDFGALIRALDLAFKLKQLAAGMPSEIKEVNTTLTGKLDLEWEIALKKIYGQPLPGEVVDVEAAPAPPSLPHEQRPGETAPVPQIKNQKSKIKKS